MKKVLLTAMALLTIASASAFGMYGSNSDWIDFLVHGNQFRARMNQLGFTLGNGTIKGTFGFKSEQGSLASIIKDSVTGGNHIFLPTVSAGIGYTSEAFGIGLGYAYKLSTTTVQVADANNNTKNQHLSVHTPVLTINALNNNLRIAVPISVAVQEQYKDSTTKAKQEYVGVSTEAQIRYYTGIDAFSLVRLYLKYGHNAYNYYNTDGKLNKDGTSYASTFGFDLRLFFLKTTVGNVVLDPFIKVTFDTALDAKGRMYAGNYNKILADSAFALPPSSANITGTKYDSNPYSLAILPSLGLNASSDIVTLYLEPSLGYRAKHDGLKNSKVVHALAWAAYAELYITPVKDLEWYFEINVNNDGFGNLAQASNLPVYFESSTGITWYLPELGGAQ